MKTAVYICRCGSNIAEKINEKALLEKVRGMEGVDEVVPVDLLCSPDGKEALAKELREKKPERVVIAACSPRDHETTFRMVLGEAGMNPYMMQMTNIREQVAWVTDDKDEASRKAEAYIRGALMRAMLHEPLEEKEIDVNTDVLIIGAGPAGMKAAVTLAESGRKVYLVEKAPFIGGMPVLFEEVFPGMECGSCMLEPLMDEVLHGENSGNIELLTMSEVEEVLGFYGNFMVKVRKKARRINLEKCIGCAECVGPCPVSAKNPYNCRMDDRKAVSFPFAGSLPAAPYIDESLCLRTAKGEKCSLCKDACPVEGAVDYEGTGETAQVEVGAVLVAVGAGLYDLSRIPNLGYGSVPGVYSSLEFERLLSANGPTGGKLEMPDGTTPKAVCIVHCAGSLDPEHVEYCSGICCQDAFKFNHMIGKQAEGAEVYHLYKELVMPGKEEFSLYREARENPNSKFMRYSGTKDIKVSGGKGGIKVSVGEGGEALDVDMVVLCPAMVPNKGMQELSGMLGLKLDATGFLEELHGRMDSVQSTIKGVYIAGTCRAPADIGQAMSQGMASAGYILAGLMPGKKLEIKPICASVDEERCGGCMVCVSVCPYKAINFDAEKGKASVNAVLCYGCGTCVAACPAKAMKGNHFTSEQIAAEIRGVLG